MGCSGKLLTESFPGTAGGSAVIWLNGALVEFRKDGSVETIGPVRMHPATNRDAEPKALQVGDLDGGGVYVGKSATTGQDLHAALADEPEYLTFDEAIEAAERLRSQPGRENIHVPTPEELNVNLYQNRDKGALRGTFNTSGSFPASCYRSSESAGYYSSVQWFDGADQHHHYRRLRLPVRLVW